MRFYTIDILSLSNRVQKQFLGAAAISEQGLKVVAGTFHLKMWVADFSKVLQPLVNVAASS